MTEPEAVKPTADRRAMHVDAALAFQLQAQLVKRYIALLGQLPANPAVQPPQLAGASQIALTLRLKAARLPAQLDHVVHEFRRHPEVTCRLAMSMAFIDKGNDPSP